MPEYTQNRELETIAGYVAAAPEVRDGRDGTQFTTFRVGTNTGYGEDSETKWFGVSINNTEVQDYVRGNLRKGTPVVVEGVSSTVERNGNTYNNFQGYRVGIVDWFVIGRQPQREDDDL
jgi:single-stranded DNA-binding protein